MTRTCCLAGIALLAALTTAQPAWARDDPWCVFRSPNEIYLSFGTLDPSRGFAAQQAAQAVRDEDRQVGDCQRIQGMRLSVEGGLHGPAGQLRMQHVLRSDVYLRYTVDVQPDYQRGPGTGRYIRFTLTGTIHSADLADAPAGEYSDALRVSVMP
jgi:hypothetical protein